VNAVAWCVYCRSAVDDNATKCPSCAKPLSDGSKVVRCPSCAKLIIKSAKQCKFCGMVFQAPAPPPAPPPAEEPAAPEAPVETIPVEESAAAPQAPVETTPVEESTAAPQVPVAPPPPPVSSAPPTPPPAAAKPVEKSVEQPKKKKKRFPWVILIILLLVCAVAGTIFFLRHRKATATDENDTQAYISSCKSVAYSMLMREPARYEGAHLTFSGKVLRVLEGGTEALQLTQFNPVTLSEGDLWSGFYRVQEGEAPFAEGAELTVYGECLGVQSYRNARGETVTTPVIQIVSWEEADLERLSAGQDPVFTVGETWTIDGLCDLTVTGVKQIKNDDPDRVAAKYLVDYTYTNYGYRTETSDGIYIVIDEIILDSAGTMGYRFPAEVKNPPVSAPIGESRKVQCCVGLEHVGPFQLTVNIYDANFNTYTARLNLSAE